jgi:hypothetical protein
MGHKRQGTTALYSHLFQDAFEGVEEALHAVLRDAVRVNRASTAGSVTTEYIGTQPNGGSGVRRVAGPMLAH